MPKNQDAIGLGFQNKAEVKIIILGKQVFYSFEKGKNDILDTFLAVWTHRH